MNAGSRSAAPSGFAIAGALDSGPGLIASTVSETAALAATSQSTSATQANHAAPGSNEPGDARPGALAYSDANISAANSRPQTQHNQPMTLPLWRDAISAPMVASKTTVSTYRARIKMPPTLPR